MNEYREIKIKSMTKELIKTIESDYIRKNCTKIYLMYNEEDEFYYYDIYFKPDTVISAYDGDYINRGTWAKKFTDDPVHDINDWLKEITDYYC